MSFGTDHSRVHSRSGTQNEAISLSLRVEAGPGNVKEPCGILASCASRRPVVASASRRGGERQSITWPGGHHDTSRRIAHNGVWSRLSTGVDGVVDVPVDQEATTQVSDAQHLWNAAAQILRAQVSEAVWHSTFSDARPVNLDGGLLVVAVPSTARERARAGSLRGDGP